MAKAVANPGYGLPGGGWGFWITQDQVEPMNDPAWALAPESLKRQFWNEAARLGSDFWQLSREKGLDRHGRPLRPIHPLTRQARKDDVNSVTARRPYSPMGRAKEDAKPLTPVGSRSRTRSLLRTQFFDTGSKRKGIWFYWVFDFHTRRYWGEILARHAQGFRQYFRYPKPGFGYVPPRDVMGLSSAEVANIAKRMRTWWEARRPAVVRAAGMPVVTVRPRRIAVEIDRAKILPRSERGEAPAWMRGQRTHARRTSQVSALDFKGVDRGRGVAGYQKVHRPVASPAGPGPDPSAALTAKIRARRQAALPEWQPPTLVYAEALRKAEDEYLELLNEWAQMPEGPERDAFWADWVAPALVRMQQARRRRGA
jgi:hypothetical protein